METEREPAIEPSAPQPRPESADGLLSRLLALRFTQRKANDILQQYSTEKIKQALDFLPYRGARNPAAYLLSELAAGDYAAPVSNHAPPKRIMTLPQPSPEDIAQRQQAEAESERLRQALNALSPDTRTALFNDARRQCVWLRTTADDSPLLLAQVELMLKDRLETLNLQECA